MSNSIIKHDKNGIQYEHKDIFFNGFYHNAIYKGSELIWEKGNSLNYNYYNTFGLGDYYSISKNGVYKLSGNELKKLDLETGDYNTIYNFYPTFIGDTIPFYQGEDYNDQWKNQTPSSSLPSKYPNGVWAFDDGTIIVKYIYCCIETYPDGYCDQFLISYNNGASWTKISNIKFSGYNLVDIYGKSFDRIMNVSEYFEEYMYKLKNGTILSLSTKYNSFDVGSDWNFNRYSSPYKLITNNDKQVIFNNNTYYFKTLISSNQPTAKSYPIIYSSDLSNFYELSDKNDDNEYYVQAIKEYDNELYCLVKNSVSNYAIYKFHDPSNYREELICEIPYSYIYNFVIYNNKIFVLRWAYKSDSIATSPYCIIYDIENNEMRIKTKTSLYNVIFNFMEVIDDKLVFGSDRNSGHLVIVS